MSDKCEKLPAFFFYYPPNSIQLMSSFNLPQHSARPFNILHLICLRFWAEKNWKKFNIVRPLTSAFRSNRKIAHVATTVNLGTVFDRLFSRFQCHGCAFGSTLDIFPSFFTPRFRRTCSSSLSSRASNTITSRAFNVASFTLCKCLFRSVLTGVVENGEPKKTNECLYLYSFTIWAIAECCVCERTRSIGDIWKQKYNCLTGWILSEWL